MPAYIYGNDYSDVGNRALAYDAARDRRYSDSLAQLRANAALQLQAQQSQADQGYRAAALQAQLAEQARDNAFRDRAFTTTQAADTRDYRYRTGQDEIRNLLNLLQIRTTNSRIGQDDATRRADMEYKEALDALTQAKLPLDKVMTKFPNLGPVHKSRLGEYYSGLVAQEDQQIAERNRSLPELQSQIRAIMGQPDQLRNRIKQLNATRDDALKHGDKENARLIEDHLRDLKSEGTVEDYEKLAQRRLNAIISDQNISENFIVNPVTGKVKLKQQERIFPAPSAKLPSDVAPLIGPMTAPLEPRILPPMGGWGTLDSPAVPANIRPPAPARVMSDGEKQQLRALAERSIREGRKNPAVVGRIFFEQTGEPLF